MPLIGNDIVDLKHSGAPGKSGDRRFVERVLTPGEQAALQEAERPDMLLWAFWAAKEAAYKAVSKAFPDVSSAPRRYPAEIHRQIQGSASGIVATPRGAVGIRIFLNEEFIHCLAAAGGCGRLADVVYGIEEIAPGSAPVSVRESAAARKAAADRIAAFLGCRPEDIGILRSSGPSGQRPPVVFVRGKRAPIDISLSHDGRFAAYAFRVTA